MKNHNENQNYGRNTDDNPHLVVPVETSERFERRMRQHGLTAWIDRGGVTGCDVFAFSGEDDPEIIQALRDEFGLN